VHGLLKRWRLTMSRKALPSNNRDVMPGVLRQYAKVEKVEGRNTYKVVGRRRGFRIHLQFERRFS
jgi:hypothetical protein